jgi:hypothetical protein
LAEVNNFDEMFCSAVDQVLEELFSPTVTKSLYMHLRDNYGLSREKVPYQLDKFFSALDNVFGVQSSLAIGKLLARSLRRSLSGRLDNDPSFALPTNTDEQTALTVKVNQLSS